MRDLVGVCQQCGKEIHCENGFLNGIVRDDGKLSCFDCEQTKGK